MVSRRQILVRSWCTVETILGDILTWSWFSEPHGYNFNGLLIPHAAGNICIDPVEPGEEVLSELGVGGLARSLSPIAITCGRQTAFASAPEREP